MIRPLKPEEVRQTLQVIIKQVGDNMGKAGQAPEDLSRSPLIFSVRKHLKDICPGDDQRREVMGWVLEKPGPVSTGDLSIPELVALKRWVGARKNDGEYIPDENLVQEWGWCRWAASNPLETSPLVEAAIELGGVVTNGEETKAVFKFD